MSVQNLLAADTFALSTGRLGSIVGGGLALAGVIAGALALARRTGRPGAVVALTGGLAGLVLGGLVVATADGGVGTGNGLAGGYVALVVGLVAVVLGALALTRRTRQERATHPGTVSPDS